MLYILKHYVIACLFIVISGCSDGDTTPSNNNLSTSGFAIKGISMVAPVTVVDTNILQPILSINANSISIMPYAFLSVDHPEVRYNQHRQHWGENSEGVIASIEMAHKNNLSVMLKPHLWIGRGVYTGGFTLPTENDWLLWEESYRRYILHFASIADSMKAEIFCIGTELEATIKERPQFWNLLIDTLKLTYHGKLTYAANWDEYKKFPFWEKLNYIGVDAYFPLTEDKTPSINSFKKGWKKYRDELEKISMAHNRPILFTEYGYRNVDYTGKEPWKENEARPDDPFGRGNQNNQAQVNALEALYQSFAGKKWFAGGFIWKWYVEERRRRSDIDYSPQNKPAAKVIENWYSN